MSQSSGLEMQHEAYTVCPPASISAQIESIASFDNHVLLGTRKGDLLMYAVEQNASERKMDLQLRQFVRAFSAKPITQIDVIPEYQLLFSLSDCINVNHINRHNFPIAHSAVKTKGATIFALDVKRSTSLTGETALVVRLCVAIKRKLQFWYWKHDKLLEFCEVIDLSDAPKSLVWLENTICIGFKTDYILYDISGERPRKVDLFPTSSSKTIDPCITIINDCFAVVKDEFLIAVDPKSSTLSDSAVNEKLLMDPMGGNKSSKRFKSFAWTQPVISLVWDEPYAVGLLNSNSIEVRVLDASGSMKDTYIQSLGDVQKARHLVRSRKGLLFAASISQLWCIQAIDVQKQCRSLLENKKFQLALQLTEISDESSEEKQVKKHDIQTMYALDLFSNKLFKESMQEFAKLETDPCDVIRLFPDLFPKDSMAGSAGKKPSAANSSLPTLVDKDLELGLLALIDYLTEVRYNLLRQMQNSETKTLSKNSKNLLSIIDTTLLKCYLQTNDSLVASVIRMNHCHLEESEKTLRQYQKFGELIILYQTKGHHKKALQLLQSQADVPSSSLFGHERTIQYLQHLGNEHRLLIFEFASWIIEKHPEDGLRIFTEDIQEVENLNRPEVLDYLLKNHKNLVTPYLEHVVHIWNETKPIFHNILIKQYRDTIIELRQEIRSSPTGNDVRQKGVARENARDKLLEFLRKSNYFTPETVLNHFPEDDLFEERAIILGKLGRHEKVLAIHVQVLGNINKAIEYCESVYANDPVAAKTIFIQLIEILLKPPVTPPYTSVELHPRCLEPNVEAVLDLLQNHATKLDPHAVLQILPNDISLIRLLPFLETALHHSLERRRNNQVLKGLLYAATLQLQEQRMHLESKSVHVYDYSVCPVCKKKFTNQSALIRYPDGKIVHYKCSDRTLAN